MAIYDKTQTLTQCSKLQGKQPFTNNKAHYKKKKKKIQPNYYPLVESVDSSTTESTCIFPEILNKHINACVENTSKTKINSLFHRTQNKDIYHE